jgi:hypothetical protein
MLSSFEEVSVSKKVTGTAGRTIAEDAEEDWIFTQHFQCFQALKMLVCQKRWQAPLVMKLTQ